MAELALQFDKDQLRALAARYEYDDDSVIADDIGPRARERGYFTKPEFLALCHWKTPRSQPRVASNPAELIKDATRIALSTPHERRSDGSRFWRLYVESGSRHSGNLGRTRIYIGRQGGLELREAIRIMREAYFARLGEEFGVGPCRTSRELMRKLGARMAWEMAHVYDQYGNYCPDALARRLGYADTDEQ